MKEDDDDNELCMHAYVKKANVPQLTILYSNYCWF